MVHHFKALAVSHRLQALIRGPRTPLVWLTPDRIAFRISALYLCLRAASSGVFLFLLPEALENRRNRRRISHGKCPEQQHNPIKGIGGE